MERRHFQGVEVRTSADGKTLSGIAARYNTLSHPIGGVRGAFRERIVPGAFDRILSTKPDVVMLVNHDANKLLGRTSSGTLQLRSTSRGLEFNCDLPNTSTAKDLHESVKRGDINGCSFAFNLGQRDDEWSELTAEEAAELDEDLDDVAARPRVEGRSLVRTIRNFSQLFDVSAVTHPAYPNTSIDARQDVVSAEVRNRVELFFNRPTMTPEQFQESLAEMNAKMFSRIGKTLRERNQPSSTARRRQMLLEV